MASSSLTSIINHATSTSAVAAATSTNRAPSQGGIFDGLIPTHVDKKNPIVLFIIQAVIVIALVRALHWPLSKLRQPRVIAEVVTGIILGPSIMGRIPGFTANIFPTDSMPAFSLVANLGLVLFLFLVGVEVDLRFLISNWRIALSVGAAGMILPFGLGYAIAWGLYHQFHNDPNVLPINFATYGLFIGIATAITAFPVLCRILTSLRLLSTPVGVIVLSAGVANDVVGWILLALCVTLVNSGGGLVTLYILLTSVGYALFVAYPVRWSFNRYLRATGALSNGPSQTVVAVTIFMVLASAFFTQIIGIHAIFGAFMIGLICPHEGGFAIKITEKLEDLVSTLFLPLYFALSGLSTNLGLLNDGLTWAYVIGVIAVAFFGKLAGGTFAAKLCGMLWGESITIGVLMSCKGLVELIVLNIGLQARILSPRTFTIFVIMALVTTFATTPLTMRAYPPAYQQKVALWKQGKVDWDGNPIQPSEDAANAEANIEKTNATSKMLVYLRLDALPSIFRLVSLFTGPQHQARSRSNSSTAPTEADGTQAPEKNEATEEVVRLESGSSGTSFERPLRLHGLRLMELTERYSSMMKVSELQEYASRDPIIKAFGISAAGPRSSRNITVSGQIAIVPEESFASTLVQQALENNSDFVLVPWSETGTVSERAAMAELPSGTNPVANPQYTALATKIFDKASTVTQVGIFIDKTLFTTSLSHGTIGAQSNPASAVVERVEPNFQLSRCVTGLSIIENEAPIMFRSTDTSGRQSIRALYTGSLDSLLAVRLALQLAKNEEIDVCIFHATEVESEATDGEFDLLMASVSLHVKDRVKVEVIPGSNPESIINALLSTRSARSSDLTLIIGRGTNKSPSSMSQSQHLASTAGTGAVAGTEATIMSPATARSMQISTSFNNNNNSHAASGSGSGSSSSNIIDHTRSLGLHTASLIARMMESGTSSKASLLVVQARVNEHAVLETNQELRRKASRVSSTDST